MRVEYARRILIVLICGAVLLLVLCGYTYHNRSGKYAQQQKLLAEKRAAVENSEATINRLEAMEQRYLDARTKLSVLEQGVSEQAYIPTLLKQLELQGEDVNLRVVGVRPKPKQVLPQKSSGTDGEAAKPVVKPYDELDIDVQVDGKYWDVVHFLEDVTSFPKIIAVREMQIRPIGDVKGKSSPDLSARISVTAFILKEDAVTAKAGPNGGPADARI